MGIRAKGKRRFKVTTDSNHDLPIAQNLLDRQFLVAEPDKVWAGDITCIHTGEGWLFLAEGTDLFSRQVVGWSLREDMTRDIVIDALRMAWFKRHPSKTGGLMFHSDRGSQYASNDFRDVLKEYGITACQPDEVRARLACQATKASQFVTRSWGTDSRGKVKLP